LLDDLRLYRRALASEEIRAHAAVPAGDALKPKPDALEAWKDMRFGMFICWGPVSLTGKEIGWSRGDRRRSMSTTASTSDGIPTSSTRTSGSRS